MEAPPLRRLPGIVFRHEVPTPPDVLPRMDVAGFVGLAAQGPVGVPVPVEDAGRFRDVFGPDLPLAWDEEAGRTASAFLGPAVEAFFRHGGRRAWVLREARGAATARFPVPTLLDAATGVPAEARARCPGAWADGLRAGAVLDARSLAFGGLRYDAATAGFSLTVYDTAPLAPADLLRFTLTTDAQVRQALLAVRTVRDAAGRQLVATGAARVLLRRPPAPEARYRVRAEVAGGGGDVSVGRLEHAAGQYRFEYGENRGPEPEPGGVLHLTVTAGPLIGRAVWLAVGEVERLTRAVGADRWRITAADVLWPEDPAAVDPATLFDVPEGGTLVAERLHFGLVLWDGREVHARLDGLGFVQPNARGGAPERLASRFWAYLPTDQTLFALVDDRPALPEAALARAAFSPRFPLAGPEVAAPLYVPFAMPDVPDREAARAPLNADPETRLGRDGLEGFDPRWFVDRDLAEGGLGALLASVFDQHYIRKAPLAGAHAFWPLDEVTLCAAPDAVQPGWHRAAPDLPDVLAPPRRPRAMALDAPGGFRIRWRPSPTAGAEFELQESADPLFAVPEVRYRGPNRQTYVYFGRESACGEDLGCVGARHYRLRVRAGGQVSPWSTTLRLDPAPAGFRVCRTPLRAPRLRFEPAVGPEGLRWTDVGDPEPNATPEHRYVLEQAFEPGFGEPQGLPLDAPDVRSYRFDALPERTAYFRVRAERVTRRPDGTERPEGAGPAVEQSPWSNTLRYDPPVADRWTMRTPSEYDDGGGAAALLAVHRSLLRLGAAHGHIVSVLTLPAHYRTEAVAAYVGALTPDPADDLDGAPVVLPPVAGLPFVLPLGFGEAPALSYGAVYHPWLGVRDGTARRQPVRYVPPDGAVLGLMARRALARGAWVAPASEALRDVVALEPAFDDVAWAALLARGVNVLRPTPRGFMPLSAETLAPGPLRPLNVRRLLILLRRICLREGHAFTFESNTAALRERIGLRFEGILTRLFVGGAFAGARPEHAFQVRTDDAVNPPEGVDRGRLLVEVKVAPSQPLAFLTVRLVQRDGAGLTTVEA